MTTSPTPGPQANKAGNAMHAKAPATDSPHRHISFTAHYTGHVWHQLGWSHPALLTPKGARLGRWLAPIERWMVQRTGQSITTTLRARHTLIDREIERLIALHPDVQVLELAAGLSPRGWRFKQRHPHLLYIEADLPQMAATKRQALAQIAGPVPEVVALDVFSDQFGQVLGRFDRQKPLLIVSEGLVNYFDLTLLAQLWQRLAQGLAGFAQGFYVTDLYARPVAHPRARLILSMAKLLKYASRSAFAYHYESPAEVEAALQQAGFKTVQVFQPSDADHPEQRAHQGDLVWVVRAQV